MDLISNTAEEILKVRGWYSTVDIDDDNTFLIKDSENRLLTKLYVSESGFAIAWGQSVVALATLSQAYTWLAQAIDTDGLPEENQPID